MKNTEFYSQAEHSVVVSAADGSFTRALRDFAEGDDAIAVEAIGDRVALSQGLDKSVVSFSSTDGGQITIKLKPTSPDIGFLNKLFNAQKSTPVLLDITVSTGVRDVVTLKGAGIQKDGWSSGGPTAQPRGFVFIGGRIDFDENEGQ